MKINLQSLSNTKIIVIALTLVLVSFCCGASIVGFAISTQDTEQVQVVDKVITKVVEITQEPYPTYTMFPTQIKLPTQTKYPTYTPLPVAPVTSTPSTFVEVYRFSGSGKGTTDMFGLPAGILKISWKYIGNSNFILHFWNLETSDEEFLANDIGTLEASAILPIDGGNEYMFEIIEGTGTWEIVVEHKP